MVKFIILHFCNLHHNMAFITCDITHIKHPATYNPQDFSEYMVWVVVGMPVTRHPLGRRGCRLAPQPPQNVACGFPALRSSEFVSQHS